MLDMYRMFVVPEGKWGEEGAALMVDLGDDMSKNVVELLDLQPTDNVIEIGFGPGIGLETLAKVVTNGSIVGVDPSDVMHRLAGTRNAINIDKGQLSLLKGTVAALPFADTTFDAAISMDNMHFWKNPQQGLLELKRVLRPGGKLVCSFTPSSGGSKHGWKALFTKTGYVDFVITENQSGICLFAKVPQ